MSQLGEVTMTVTRQAPGTYNRDTGKWEDGVVGPTTFPITASVQPITPRLAEMLENAMDHWKHLARFIENLTIKTK